MLKPWITDGLLKSIRNKNKMFKRLQNHHNNLALNEEYKAHHNTLNRSLRLAKQNHYHNIFNEHKGNSKKASKVINELAFDKKKTSIPPTKLITTLGDTITDQQSIAEEFNKYFVNVGKSMADSIVSDKPSNEINYKVNTTSNSFFLLPCSSQEVFDLIKKLKYKKAKRTLDTETKFVKYANPVLSVYLSELFNLRVKEGTYRDPLKIAAVIPIFRKGDRSKTTNYRPITTFSQFDKIFEKLLYTRLYSYLIRYNLLSDQQFGFRTNSSTTLAISKLYE